VLKAGFLDSGRYSNGIVVARLANGTWSAPSAIGLRGAWLGGQIGFELTDFVFVLNDAPTVRAFSQLGSLILGGNVSLAAGRIGRNAEAAGAASLKCVAGVFSYSKTKGLFAGVSLEGSAIVERRDTNGKFYGIRYTASQLMEGSVRPPPAAASLMSVLNSRVFSGVGGGDDSMYNDVPQYDDRHDDVVWEGRRGSGYGEGVRRNRGDSYTGANDDYAYSNRPKLLGGSVRPPPIASAPMSVLNSRVFAGISGLEDTMYNGVPPYHDRHVPTAAGMPLMKESDMFDTT
jgi:SH3 domain-containing YSC84-like protein 1